MNHGQLYNFLACRISGVGVEFEISDANCAELPRGVPHAKLFCASLQRIERSCASLELRDTGLYRTVKRLMPLHPRAWNPNTFGTKKDRLRARCLARGVLRCWSKQWDDSSSFPTYSYQLYGKQPGSAHLRVRCT